jgi:hypothetical protein
MNSAEDPCLAARLAGAAEWRRKVKSGEIPDPWKIKREAVAANKCVSKTLKLEIASLRLELKALQKEKQFSEMCRFMGKKTLATKETIVAASLNLADLSGIYFLIKDKEIVYIGQSTCVFRRVYDHLWSKKIFDSFSYIQCEKKMLDKLESIYIHFYQPPENGRNHGFVCAPLRIDQLLA